MKKHALKGKQGNKPIQPPSHPWRRKLNIWATNYQVNGLMIQARIDARKK